MREEIHFKKKSKTNFSECLGFPQNKKNVEKIGFLEIDRKCFHGHF